MFAYTLVYPIDLVKTMITINKAQESLSIFGNIHHIQKTLGVRALYKGLGTTCVGIFPYAGFKFAFYEEFKRLYKIMSNDANIGAYENLVFGGLAGCCAVTITYPTDLMRRKRQAQIIKNDTLDMKYTTLVKSVYKEHGLKGFYKGLSVTYYKVIPSTALVFALNEGIKKVINVR